jgi:hypothetical protein
MNPGQVFVSKVERKGTMYFEGRNLQQLAYISREAAEAILVSRERLAEGPPF